ncbi:substrate-binding domain-containing protein [Methylocella sp.]|uniref:substrate-binding domain-containing protein n=1 Tax=Methylocella sp. TaxID=1978226 RepID=UPI00378399AA
MSDFLTTKELAALLRVRERKIYDLVAADALPVRRVTGKLLFPRAEIEAWIAGGRGPAPGAPAPAAPAPATKPPLVVAGSHDPLLEWALRESGCGLAALTNGSLDGLDRFASSGCVAAGLHVPGEGADDWNVAAARARFSDRPAALIEWAKRTRGLIYRADLGRPLRDLRAARGLRFQLRQSEASAEAVLNLLLAREGLGRGDLACAPTVERTEFDLAMAIAAGRADAGLGVEAAARQLHLEFSPLLVERFDLLVWRDAYFDPPFQTLLRFCAGDGFARKAGELGGYDVRGLGAARWNGA